MAWWLIKLNFCVSKSNYSCNVTHLMSGFWFLTNSSGLLTFFLLLPPFLLTDRRMYTLANYSLHYNLMHTSTNSSTMVKHFSCLWWSRIDVERFLRPNCKCILCSWNGLVNKDLVPTRYFKVCLVVCTSFQTSLFWLCTCLHQLAHRQSLFGLRGRPYGLFLRGINISLFHFVGFSFEFC